MFSKFMNWLKGVFKKMVNQKTVSTALNVESVVSQKMADALNVWCEMYRNESPWLNKDIKSLNLASSISREVATLAVLELKAKASGSVRADFLNEILQNVVSKLRVNAEYAVAKGGIVFKPYLKNGKIMIDYVQADNFFPVDYDGNGNINSGIFVDQKVIGKRTYTKLEYHAYEDGLYVVRNKVYVSESGMELGRETDLSSVEEWAELLPEVTLKNMKSPLFSYLKMPFANNIDPYSPLGVSIYSRAVGLIEEADKQYSRFLWENKSGERALYVDVTAFKTDENGNKVLPDTRLHKVLDSGQEGFYEEWSPQIREEFIRGLDVILKKIEFNCGIAYGTISDPNVTDKTATEIKMQKQRSYATVSDLQKSLETALNGLLSAIDEYADLYNLTPSGAYETTYEWSDSIIADTETEFARIERMVALGAAEPWELRVFQFGEDEETAKSRVPKQESLFGGGAVV